MRNRAIVISLLLILFVGGAAGAPSFTEDSVLNAASFLPIALPGGSIAQGSIFTIFGTDLGPGASPPLTDFPLLTELGGVTVTIIKDGEVIASAIPLFVSGFQINAIMPSNVPLGEVFLTVSFGGETSDPVRVTIVASSVGIFTATGLGQGPGSITNFFSAASQPLNTMHVPVMPGGIVTLWVTGVGAIGGADNVSPSTIGAVVHLRDVDVYVGNILVTKLFYAGRSAQFPGLDQVIIEIPADVATGCYVPVSVGSDGIFSNDATLAISDDGEPCTDPGNPLSELLRDGGILGISGPIRTEFTVSDEMLADWSAVALGPAAGSLLSGALSALGGAEPGKTIGTPFTTDAFVSKFEESRGTGIDYSPVFSWPPMGTFTAGIYRGASFKKVYNGELPVFPSNLLPAEIGHMELRSFPPSLNLESGDGAKAIHEGIDSMRGQAYRHYLLRVFYAFVDFFNNPIATALAVSLSQYVDNLFDPGMSPVRLNSVGRDEKGSILFGWDADDDVPGYVFLCYAVFYPDSEFVRMVFGFAPARDRLAYIPYYYDYYYYYSSGLNGQPQKAAAGKIPLDGSSTRLLSLMYIPSMEEGFANFADGKDGKALKAAMQNQVWEYPIE